MSIPKITRRQMLLGSGALLAGRAFSQKCAFLYTEIEGESPFPISLNTSTISGYNLPVEEQIEYCAEAGFDGIELWNKDIEAYQQKGKTLNSLQSLLRASGLTLYNIIGFSPWIAGGEGIEQMKREMEIAAALNSQCIAATALGIDKIDRNHFDLYAARYREILEYGEKMNVQPLLEVWGTGALNKLTDAIYIAMEAKHPKASMLLDFYHLYRGDNSFESLRLINGAALPIFHINDYPITPARIQLVDSDRVYPGDGVCPFEEVLPILYESGFRGALSLELFNPEYWQHPNVKVALRTGYEKVLTVINRSINQLKNSI